MNKIKFTLYMLALIAFCLFSTAPAAVAQEATAEQQQQQDESQRATEEQGQPAETAATPQSPDPNEMMMPSPQASQSVDGDLIFTSPGQSTYARDIKLSDNFGGLRFYGANSLTTSPAGAAIQFFGNNAGIFSGQLFLDSGAVSSGALIFRTAPLGGTITERMRVTSIGQVAIGTTQPSGGMLHVVTNGTAANGVVGEANTSNGIGVSGLNTITSGIGVRGFSDSGFGVVGRSSNGVGVQGESSNGFAGRFFGNVDVRGTLIKSSGSFKIDHPLDPANRYLSHSFVESPDMMNIYNGNVVLDRHGRATVTLPNWFEALNREFRYQLTAIGAPANLYVAQEIKGNTFKIAGGKRGMKISWLVTGVRHDAYAEAHRIPLEEDKTGDERGTYLHPEAFGQPAEKGVTHARQSAATPQPEAERGKETTAVKRTAPSQQ